MQIKDEDIAKINEGIKLEDGISKMKTTRVSDNIVKVVMNEGKNRQIRRTLEAIDRPVIKLVRIRVGKFSSHKLAQKEYMFIKPEDVL